MTTDGWAIWVATSLAVKNVISKLCLRLGQLLHVVWCASVNLILFVNNIYPYIYDCRWLGDMSRHITRSKIVIIKKKSKLCHDWDNYHMWLGVHQSTRYPWASCQIRKIAGAHALGMPGTFSPSPQVSDPDMHHGTCVTHVPWCMPGSLTSSFLWNRRRGKTFPAFPAHAQPAILRIW